MTRQTRFTFLVSPDERKQIAALADLYQRSQADTLRLLVREKARELKDGQKSPPCPACGRLG